MLAKIVSHGRDRAESMQRLAAALDATTILGLTTNLRFLRWLVRAPVLRDGLVRTDTLDRVWPPADWSDAMAVPDAAWSQAAASLRPGVAVGDAYAGGWRLNGPTRLRVATDDQVRTVEVVAQLDPAPFSAVRVGATVHLDLGGLSTAFRVAPPPDIDQAARRATTDHRPGAGSIVVAPMPGSVLVVHAAPGGVVAAGDPIVTLEAMKMEHVVAATSPGRIGELLVRAGDQVVRGERLATIEP